MVPHLQTSLVNSCHWFTLQLGNFFFIRIGCHEKCKVAWKTYLFFKKWHLLTLPKNLKDIFTYRANAITVILKWACHYSYSTCVTCKLPKADPVVWSLGGIIEPSLLLESQSHSTPNSGGGLLTQPQKSLSKSQKPSKKYTDTLYSWIHTV